jgi:hypothetical protein
METEVIVSLKHRQQ